MKGKKRAAPNKLNKKDIKHLKDFGELHPADLESQKKKSKFAKDAELGILQRKIFKEKPKKELNIEDDREEERTERKKNKKVEEKIESESDDEIMDESLTREDLLALLKRETEDEQVKEAKIVQNNDELEDEDLEDEIAAEDTWKVNVNKSVTDSDILHIENKSTYKAQKVPFKYYNRSKYYHPLSCSNPEVPYFDEPENLHIKERLRRNIRKMEPREKELFSVFHQYKDVYCASTSRKVCQAYVMHALNHVTKTDKMTRNNSQKLLTMTEMEKNDSDIRDKQLMKPKVLIIVPFKSVAKKVMDEIERQMTPPSGKFEIGYKKRFEKEFGSDPKLEKIKREKNRPDDYKRTFAGNNEEAFRVGLSFSPKAIRLYAPFYSSDIIIASPLGLRTIIGDEGEDSAKQEFDFLSSIEILIVEHGDNILMQNPSHLQHLADHLNLQPKEAHDCDFSRVRLWAAEGKSKYFRQNIILTHTPNEWFNSFMNQYSINMNGMVTMAPMEITGSLGVKNVPLPVPQLFQRIEGATRADAFKNRMKTFCKIIGDLVKAKLDGILIYIPSFYDFVKIRNYMEENSMKFLTLNEYSERAEAKRVRTMFENAEMPFLLFTERRHFYHRIVQRKVKRIIFFQPPTFGNFYSEVSNFIISAALTDITVLYSKFDQIQIELIVGKSETKKLMKSEKSLNCFMTERK